MIKIDTSWFIRKIFMDRTEIYKDVIGYYTIVFALLMIMLILILPLPLEDINKHFEVGKSIISIMFLFSIFGYLIIFPAANKIDYITKCKLKGILIYDIKNLATILKYPSDNLLREPEIDNELHEYYAWRDGGSYRNSQNLWELSSSIAKGDARIFVPTMTGMEKFIDSEILIHKNNTEWAVKFKVNGNEYTIPSNIDKAKYSIYNGNITDLLRGRWEEVVIYKIDNNPFYKMTKRFEKPIKFIDIWNCVKFINDHHFFKGIK